MGGQGRALDAGTVSKAHVLIVLCEPNVRRINLKIAVPLALIGLLVVAYLIIYLIMAIGEMGQRTKIEAVRDISDLKQLWLTCNASKSNWNAVIAETKVTEAERGGRAYYFHAFEGREKGAIVTARNNDGSVKTVRCYVLNRKADKIFVAEGTLEQPEFLMNHGQSETAFDAILEPTYVPADDRALWIAADLYNDNVPE
jgi:hypothetical protein